MSKRGARTRQDDMMTHEGIRTRQEEITTEAGQGQVETLNPTQDVHSAREACEKSSKSQRKNVRGPNIIPKIPAPQNRPVIVVSSDRTFAMKDKSLSNVKISRLIGSLVREYSPGVSSFSKWDKKLKNKIWTEFLKHYQLGVDEEALQASDVAIEASNVEREAHDMENEVHDVEKEAQEKLDLESNAKLTFMCWARGLYSKSLSKARVDLKKEGIENPAEWAQHPPKYMEEQKEAWEECCQLWGTDEWQQKSINASENRQSGDDRAHTLGGSINACEIRRRLEQENPGRIITYIDIARKVKMRPSGEWVDPKSQQVVEDYNNRMINEYGEDWSQTHGDDDDIWLNATGGNKHGDIYMIGSVVHFEKLKRSRTSQYTAACSRGGRWVTQDEMDKMHELQEKDRQEIELLRKEQAEQKERNRLFEEEQARDRQDVDRLRKEMLEMHQMMRESTTSSTPHIRPSQVRKLSRHEQLLACRDIDLDYRRGN